jgi:hypothetical protein
VAAVSAPTCLYCTGVLNGTRLVLGGHYMCPDCAYLLEYGESERAPEKAKPGPPQEETLFPVGPYLKRDKEG